MNTDGTSNTSPAEGLDISESKTETGSNKPCYVGLDMSLTSTGFFKKQGDIVTMETIKTTPKTCPNDLARIRYIVDSVMSRIPKDVKMVCIEDFFTPANPFQIGAATGLAMLGAVMRLALYEAGMPMFIVAPSQIKKFVTGKGTGQKSIVVRDVFKKWGYDVKDDNQADACVLAYIAEALCVPDPQRPKYQQEVIKAILADRPRYNVETLTPSIENPAKSV